MAGRRRDPSPASAADDRLANVLAAFALALSDKVGGAVTGIASGRSPTTPAALVQIGFNSNMSIDALRMALGLSHSATVRVVDQLQKEGLVQRARLDKQEKGDSRVSHLALTPAGQAMMEEILGARRQATLPALASLSAAERSALNGLIERMLPNLITSRVDEEHVCRLCDERACPQDVCPAVCTEPSRP